MTKETKQISITRALVELKNLDARIQTSTHDLQFVTFSLNGKVKNNVAASDFTKEAIASYRSIEDLITQRDRIKTAIVKSNAETVVEIAGEKMTVATAIERKKSIAYKSQLFNHISKQLNVVEREVAISEPAAKDRAEKLATEMYGSKDKITSEMLVQFNKFIDDQIEKNAKRLVMNDEQKRLLTTLNNYIENFLKEVDFVLSESNATTKIAF